MFHMSVGYPTLLCVFQDPEQALFAICLCFFVSQADQDDKEGHWIQRDWTEKGACWIDHRGKVWIWKEEVRISFALLDLGGHKVRPYGCYPGTWLNA